MRIKCVKVHFEGSFVSWSTIKPNGIFITYFIIVPYKSHFTVNWYVEPLRLPCGSAKELIMLHSHRSDMTSGIKVFCNDNCRYLKDFFRLCPIFSQFSERWRVRHWKSRLQSVINNQLYHFIGPDAEMHFCICMCCKCFLRFEALPTHNLHPHLELTC